MLQQCSVSYCANYVDVLILMDQICFIITITFSHQHYNSSVALIVVLLLPFPPICQLNLFKETSTYTKNVNACHIVDFIQTSAVSADP